MNNMQRTLTYLAIAVAAVVVAWEPWRSAPQAVDESEDEARLFPSFKDPLDAKSLEITKYDEATSTLEKPFKVAQLNGRWSIPSHHNYPADANEHMAKAAASLIDLEALGKVSDNSGDRELYGVIEPDIKTLRAGDAGVGMRVTMRDLKDEVLADLIIGKTVKDQPDLRYVRKAGHGQIYKVALKTDALSTKFEDWIEKDLLKLKTMDVKDVELNDYTSDASAEQGQILIKKTPRSKIKLANNDEKSTWELLELTEYDKKSEPIVKKLGEDEELNTAKLNELKRALGDLKIVNVQPKPKGLSADLKASAKFAEDNEGLGSLITKGFYPVPVTDDKIEIYSSDGEVVCGLKDGVEYVLRFGNATESSPDDDDKAGDKADGKKDDPSRTKMNRFIFVMAQLNKDLIAKPTLEPVPGEEAADEEKKADDDTAKKADDQPDDAKDANKADTAKDKKAKDEKSKDEKPKDAKAKSDKPKSDKAKDVKAKPDKPKADAKADKPKADEDKSSDGNAKEKEAKDKEAKDDESKDEKAKDEKAAPSKEAKAKTADEEAAEEEKARLADEKRNSIKKQNKRKQAEYDDRVAEGEKRVKELNDRFADWYYVIPDSVYRNIHLSRADIVKNKDKAAGKHDDHDHDHEDGDHADDKVPDFNSLPKFDKIETQEK